MESAALIVDQNVLQEDLKVSVTGMSCKTGESGHFRSTKVSIWSSRSGESRVRWRPSTTPIVSSEAPNPKSTPASSFWKVSTSCWSLSPSDRRTPVSNCSSLHWELCTRRPSSFHSDILGRFLELAKGQIQGDEPEAQRDYVFYLAVAHTRAKVCPSIHISTPFIQKDFLSRRNSIRLSQLSFPLSTVYPNCMTAVRMRWSNKFRTMMKLCDGSIFFWTLNLGTLRPAISEISSPGVSVMVGSWIAPIHLRLNSFFQMVLLELLSLEVALWSLVGFLRVSLLLLLEEGTTEPLSLSRSSCDPIT